LINEQKGDSLKIVFFGTPDFAVPAFKNLLSADVEISAVVTQPDRQSGRGRKISPCPVKVEALSAGLKVLQPERVKDKKFCDELFLLKPSAIVVVAYGQILSPEIIHFPEYGCVNIHASLLPRYRGASINGDKVTGVSTMLMDEGMDTGPVLIQEEVDIKPDDTADTLSWRLSKKGADIIIPTLRGLSDGAVKPKPQAGEPSYAPVLKKSDGLIDWTKSSGMLNNFVRGMNPWPGAFSLLGAERIKILRAVPVDGVGDAGIINAVTKDSLFIGTGQGILSILELQTPGKPAMPIKAFLQGRNIKPGMRFHSQND
jgi:methionyl-tRNA formyltransferase